jgi:hypothetical protein
MTVDGVDPADVVTLLRQARDRLDSYSHLL